MFWQGVVVMIGSLERTVGECKRCAITKHERPGAHASFGMLF